MRILLLLVFIMYPFTKAVGQANSLSECGKKYRAWKTESPPDYLGDVPMPIPVKFDAPIYPDSARQAQKEGTVWI
jgi:hypothetical protein